MELEEMFCSVTETLASTCPSRLVKLFAVSERKASYEEEKIEKQYVHIRSSMKCLTIWFWNPVELDVPEVMFDSFDSNSCIFCSMLMILLSITSTLLLIFAWNRNCINFWTKIMKSKYLGTHHMHFHFGTIQVHFRLKKIQMYFDLTVSLIK